MAVVKIIFEVVDQQYLDDNPDKILRAYSAILREGIFVNDGRFAFGDGVTKLSDLTFFGGSIAWGNIVGSVNNQTDLISILDTKAPLNAPHFTGNVIMDGALNVAGRGSFPAGIVLNYQNESLWLVQVDDIGNLSTSPLTFDVDLVKWMRQPTVVPPNIEDKLRLNALYLSLKAGSNNFSKTERLWIRGADVESNAMVSHVNPTSPLTTKVGAPVFSKYLGFQGGSGLALDWNYTPDTDNVLLSQDNACYWVYLTPGDIGIWGPNQSGYLLGSSNAGTDLQTSIAVTNNPSISVAVNGFAGAYQAATISEFLYMIMAIRSGHNLLDIYLNGVFIQTVSVSNSQGMSPKRLYEMANNLNGVIGGEYSAGRIFATGCTDNTINPLEYFNSIHNYYGSLNVAPIYGDSISYGSDAPDPFTQGWHYLWCAAKGYTAYNKSASGATVNTLLSSKIGIRPKHGSGGAPLIIAFGVNDSIHRTLMQYGNDLQTAITMGVNAGHTDIVVVSGNHVEDNPGFFDLANYLLFRQKAKDIIALNPQCRDLDFYPLSISVPDKIHPDQQGHFDMFTYALANI